MVLSLQKLEKLLGRKGLLPKRYFTIGGMCVYIEILVIDNADIFFLYIPSKYDIKAPKDSTSFKISPIDVNENGTIAGDYAGELDNVDLEKQYEEVDIDINPDVRTHKNLEGRLVGNYNHPLSLQDVSKKDMKQLREVFRQLRRLRLCTQSLKYKLCIVFNHYLCCIRRDDTFEGFTIKGSSGNNERKLYVSIDLESLYDKLGTISLDVKTVREGVYRVLDKNQIKHTRNLQKILEHKADFVNSSKFIGKKKMKFSIYLNDLETMLEKMRVAEHEVIERIAQINDRYNSDVSIKGLYTDIEKTHLLSKHEKRLSNITIIKQDIVLNILSVKRKLEDLSLKVDKVCFDNIVMLDAILRNFVDMTEF
jgi:hypothetical protein